MKTTKRLTLICLMVLCGFSGIGISTHADNDTTVVLCYKNRTIQVPAYLVPRYIASGATIGPCNAQ